MDTHIGGEREGGRLGIITGMMMNSGSARAVGWWQIKRLSILTLVRWVVSLQYNIMPAAPYRKPSPISLSLLFQEPNLHF